MDDALNVVSLRVGQLRFWTDSEVVSPLIVDEQSMTTEVCGDDRFSPGVTDRQTDLDSLGEMLLPRVDVSYFGRNCAMDFSTRWMCFQTWITDSSLWMLVQTLPLSREDLYGAVGFPGASPEGVAQMRGKVSRRGRVCRRGCAEESTGAGEFAGYIRPAAVDELPFCVRPVTGSHLFRPPLGRVLSLWQPHLPFGYLSGTLLGDLRFSCVLLWWNMMSSETDLPKHERL